VEQTHQGFAGGFGFLKITDNKMKLTQHFSQFGNLAASFPRTDLLVF
jgi:hypothetical protein